MSRRTTTLLCILFLCTSLIVIPLPLSSVDSSDSAMHIEWHTATDADIEAMRELMCVDGTTLSSGDPDHGTGLLMPTPEEWESLKPHLYSTKIVDSIQAGESLPSSVDHTQSDHFPPIGDQTTENSCLAWSLGYYIATFQEAVEHGWDLSGATCTNGVLSPGYQDRVFSPDFMYHQINNGYDGGLYDTHGLAFLENMGMCTWDLMPNDANDHTTWPSEDSFRQAPLYKSGDSYRCIFGNDLTIDSLKTILDAGHLAFIAVDSYQYRYLTNDTWTLDNYNVPHVNHANTVVGYDDSYSYQENGDTKYGAFKIANSWGKGWVVRDNQGNIIWSADDDKDGCYWISYETMRQRVGYYHYIDNITAYEPDAIATFAMDHNRRGDCDIMFTNTTTDESLTFTPYSTSVTSDGGAHPFPANTIAYDISDIWASGEGIMMNIFDSASSSTTGTLTSYSLEYYPIGYTPDGTSAITFDSSDTPVSTINGSTVSALVENDAMTLDLSASPTRIAANGSSTSTITATLHAADGTPIPDGTEVTFSTDGGTLSETSATTVDGACMVTLTAPTTPQTVTVSASTSDAADAIEICCIGPPHSISLEAIPLDAPADGSAVSTITATLYDINDMTVLDDTLVTFSTDGGTLSSTNATTTDGSCSVTLKSTEAKATTVTVTSGVATETVEVMFTPCSPSSIELAIDPNDIVADGSSNATVAVTVRDEHGNLVADDTEVTLSTTAGTLAETTLITTSGTASTTITSPTVAQDATVTATCEGIVQTTTVTFAPGPPATIEATPDTGMLPPDGASTTIVSAHVQDAHGNNVADSTEISFAASAGSLSAATAETTNGIASVTLTAADTPQQIDVTASVGDVTDTTQVICVGPPSTIDLSASPDPVTLSTTTEITASVTDDNGVFVLDDTEVGFTASAGTLSSSTATTVNGQATVTLTAPEAEQTIEITASSGEKSATFSIECVSTTQVTRTLHHGWNTICFPFSVNMETLTANINGDVYRYMYWYDAQEQEYKYFNVYGINNPTNYPSQFETLDAGENIWIWLNDESGDVIYENVLSDAQKEYTLGWNVIGCTSDAPRPMTELVDELESEGINLYRYIYWFDPQEQEYKYFNVYGINNPTNYPSQYENMVPGQVYWVYLMDEEE